MLSYVSFKYFIIIYSIIFIFNGLCNFFWNNFHDIKTKQTTYKWATLVQHYFSLAGIFIYKLWLFLFFNSFIYRITVTLYLFIHCYASYNVKTEPFSIAIFFLSYSFKFFLLNSLGKCNENWSWENCEWCIVLELITIKMRRGRGKKSYNLKRRRCIFKWPKIRKYSYYYYYLGRGGQN